MTRLPHPVTGAAFESPVPPGRGWPGDPASPSSPVALDGGEVAATAAACDRIGDVEAAVSVCRACPRLVSWRERVAVDKRRAFAHEPYWGRPISGWGSENPKVVVVGLAPAAHGGNRTGRIFTGDRSGDWLFASLYRVGLATQATSVHAGDGQYLLDTRLVAAVRCAPPDNKPTTVERDTCSPWLQTELSLVLSDVRVMVCLGSFAWDVVLRAMRNQGFAIPRPRPRFGHETAVELVHQVAAHGHVTVLGSYHPSQQNTFTGRLTEPMLDAVLGRAAALAGR